MHSIRNAFRLAKVSWLVILADKEMLMYPVLAMLSAILFGAAILIPTIFMELAMPEPVFAATLFLGYLGFMFILQFFNAALVSSALVRLKGGDPTLKTGFRQAWKRVGLIAQWTVLSATVGVLLSMIRQRSGFLGQLFGGLLEMGWNLLSFFVIPVLVVEGISPWTALTRSKDLLTSTWGEQLSAGIGFGLLALLVSAPVVVLVIVLFPLFPNGIVPVAVVILYLMVVMLLSTTMSGIFQAALYLYAKEKTVSDGFDAKVLNSAFH